MEGGVPEYLALVSDSVYFDWKHGHILDKVEARIFHTHVVVFLDCPPCSPPYYPTEHQNPGFAADALNQFQKGHCCVTSGFLKRLIPSFLIWKVCRRNTLRAQDLWLRYWWTEKWNSFVFSWKPSSCGLLHHAKRELWYLSLRSRAISQGEAVVWWAGNELWLMFMLTAVAAAQY